MNLHKNHNLPFLICEMNLNIVLFQVKLPIHSRVNKIPGVTHASHTQCMKKYSSADDLIHFYNFTMKYIFKIPDLCCFSLLTNAYTYLVMMQSTINIAEVELIFQIILPCHTFCTPSNYVLSPCLVSQ